MFPSKQMEALAMSWIEELPTVEKHLGGEGSPGHLDHYGIPLLQLGQDDHHLQQAVDQGGLQGGGATHHKEELKHCLWFFVRKAPR